MSIIDIWFSGLERQPKWMRNFESRLDEISKRTHMSKKELIRLAEIMHELKIIEEKEY